MMFRLSTYTLAALTLLSRPAGRTYLSSGRHSFWPRFKAENLGHSMAPLPDLKQANRNNMLHAIPRMQFT